MRFFLPFLLAFASVAGAQNAPPAEVEIRPGWRDNATGQHIAGLEIRLDPGWKTYWRAPGEGGIPPRFDWSGAENLANIDIRYPVPKVMHQYGMVSYGYERQVIFPIIAAPLAPGQPIRLEGDIEIGVCEEICIPMRFRVSATLPASGTPEAVISAALADQPRDGGQLDCAIEPIEDGLQLTVALPSSADTELATVIETGDPRIWVSQPSISQIGARRSAKVDLVPPSGKPFALERRALRMTLLYPEHAVEMAGCR